MKINNKNEQLPSKCRTPWWALYIRLSREDGDQTESFSVSHQKMKLTEYVKKIPEITNYELYIDDGWTGTNFVEVR